MTITGNQPAYRDALFKIARFGASRFGAFDYRTFISIGGVFYGDARPTAMSPGILQGSLTVQDILNETANTMSFSAWNFKPTVGAAVALRLGSKNALSLFSGYIISVDQTYLAKPPNRVFHCSCIDCTWRLMWQQAYGTYTNMSASTIVQDLIARFAPSVTGGHIQTGLPTLGELIVTNEDVLSVLKRIASRIGAYFYVDELADLHFFTTEATTTPAPIVPTHPSLSNVQRTVDLSQIVTRALSTGGGGNTSPLVVGAATIPVDVGTWYPSTGLVAIGPNRVSYSGVAGMSGAGSLIGPGVAPTTAPTATTVVGAGLPPGAYGYAFTFQTASGESKPSPMVSASSSTLPTPTVPPDVYSADEVGSTWTSNYPNYAYYLPGDTVEMAYSYSLQGWIDGRDSTPLSPTVTRVAKPSPYWTNILGPQVYLAYAFYLRPPWDAATGRFSTDPNVKFVHVWVRVNGGPWWLIAQKQPNPNPPGNNFLIDGQAAHVTPPSVGPAIGQVQLSNITLGPTGVTARKIYRTTANGAQLRLLTTVANNTSTGPLTDVAADATLGANAPVSDTSGLQVTAGQVNPGEVTIIVAGTSWADPAGGWAVIGNGKQVIRYSGLTPTTLTGIPATGIGAVVSTVPYNSSITSAPTLVGVPTSGDRAIQWAAKAGDPVNVLAMVDDVNAQAALRAAVPGHSGIVEEILSDGRLSIGEATARASALLATKSLPHVTLRYTSRDVATRSGATVTADLPPPTDIHETLKIQRVTIDGFNLSPKTGLPPTFHVEASSDRFTFEDFLRQARGE